MPGAGQGSAAAKSATIEGINASHGECSPMMPALPFGSTLNVNALSNHLLWPDLPAPEVFLACASVETGEAWWGGCG